jgi:hypothetical protein
MALALRTLIVCHRWIGVILCTLFALWYASGIGMMYWGMPSVTTGDRLARAPAIDPSRVVLSPHEAVEKTGEFRARLKASPRARAKARPRAGVRARGRAGVRDQRDDGAATLVSPLRCAAA